MINPSLVRMLWIAGAIAAGAALAAIPVVAHSAETASGADGAAAADPDADYDRLDGHGTSGKRVNVIEWEGNLEVHVYPAGSLKGLALKLDKRNKDRPVMVIGYRFADKPETQLIRRAILGIDLREGFRAYRDPSADGYDKVVISNNGLASPLALYRLEPAPTQLYPDGHPALTQAAPKPTKPAPVDGVGDREPAADKESRRRREADRRRELDESGTVQPFFTH